MGNYQLQSEMATNLLDGIRKPLEEVKLKTLLLFQKKKILQSMPIGKKII